MPVQLSVANPHILMKIFCLIFFSLVLFRSGYGQDPQLTVQVTDTAHRPVHGALVSLGDAAVRGMTDQDGKVVFPRLPAGEYRLTVSLEGYITQSLSISVKQAGLFIPVSLSVSVHHLQEVTVKDNYAGVRKQEESLNIEVISREFIRRNLGGSLMKTLERMPGVNTIGIGSGQAKPLIRGMGFNRVVVTDKGIKHEGQQWGADHGLEIDQFAAGEIELIKGAASFAYGSDAIGGVIDIKPFPVPAENTAGGSVDLVGKSNNDLYGTSLNLYGRRKNWFADARFTWQAYGDYRVPADTVYVYDYAVRLHENHLRNTAGHEADAHLAAGYAGDRFRSVFYLSNVYNKSGFFANAHGLEPRNVDTDRHDSSGRDVQMPGQQVNHLKLINRSVYSLPEHRLEMDLGYQHNFRQEFSHYVNHGYMPPVYPAAMSFSEELEREFDKQVYSANLRDQIILGDHSVTAGLNTEYQDNSINGWSFLVPAFKQLTAGVFVYDKLRLNDKVILHGAVRYDHGRIRMFSYTDWFASDVTANGVTVSEKLNRAEDLSRRFNSFVWSAGLNYNPGEFVLKANIGKAFRMPIAKELGANGVNYHYFSYERGDPALLPEQSYQADLSLGWNGDQWSVQFSPFYNYFPNYIYLNPTSLHDYYYGAGNQVFQYAQSEVMRYGAEIQLDYDLTGSLSAGILGEYLYSRQLSGDKKGYTLPFSPPASVLLNLSWSPRVNNLKDNYFSLDYRVVGRQDNIVPPEKKTPGYRVINIQAGTTVKIYDRPLLISLQVQNLLDANYLNHTSFYRLIELPEAGRNIIASLKLPFNIRSRHSNDFKTGNNKK